MNLPWRLRALFKHFATLNNWSSMDSCFTTKSTPLLISRADEWWGSLWNWYADASRSAILNSPLSHPGFELRIQVYATLPRGSFVKKVVHFCFLDSLFWGISNISTYSINPRAVYWLSRKRLWFNLFSISYFANLISATCRLASATILSTTA